MTARPPGETILLAEDDPPLRRLIRRALEGRRYQLLEACNGQEALALAANHPGPIDLLVADVVMPVMDGFTLAEQLVETHPETRVLFLTGYTDRSDSVRLGLKDGGQPFLLKPLTVDRLLRMIRDQLDACRFAPTCRCCVSTRQVTAAADRPRRCPIRARVAHTFATRARSG